MRELLSLLAIGFTSALFPLVNIEAYISVRAALSGVGPVWLLSFAAALGQMGGKYLWYRLGASSLSWGWVRRKIDKPSQRARLELWRRRTDSRPFLAGCLVFVSAVVGLPPFAVLSVVAGQLGMHLALFLGVGLAGRWLRFAAILGGVGWLEHLGVL